MDFVIDIQGFRDSKGDFIPKEVAVVALKESTISHWIVLPPCKFNELPLCVRATNDYCTTEVHGLQWFEGECTHRQLRQNLQRIARNAQRIYVRGQDKVKYLESCLGRTIINTEKYSGPAFAELNRMFYNEDVPMCNTHALKHHSFTKQLCALTKAQHLRAWLRSLNKNNPDSSSSAYYEALWRHEMTKRMNANDTGRDEIDNIDAITEDEEDAE